MLKLTRRLFSFRPDTTYADFHEKAFILVRHNLPCCGAQHTLHELKYEWPQGFARFNLCAENPSIGKLSTKQQRQFESILGCPVRIIYQHL